MITSTVSFGNKCLLNVFTTAIVAGISSERPNGWPLTSLINRIKGAAVIALAQCGCELFVHSFTQPVVKEWKAGHLMGLEKNNLLLVVQTMIALAIHIHLCPSDFRDYVTRNQLRAQALQAVFLGIYSYYLAPTDTNLAQATRK